MPPTIPHFRSPRGHCAAAAITISTSSASSFSASSGSDQSFSNTLIILSSASDSRGGDEASRGGQRSAPRHRRSPSPEPSAVPVRSATVATVASFFNGRGGHVATPTSRRATATQRRSPSPCSVLSVRAPGGVGPASSPSSGGGGGNEEVTSRRKRKLRYRKWDVCDELKVLTTLAELRRENLGVLPQASVLLKKLCADGGLLRRGVNATVLSEKVWWLKKKFVKTARKVAATGGRRLRNYRNRMLYQTSMDVWPDLLRDGVAADVLLQEARAARRRGNHAGIRL